MSESSDRLPDRAAQQSIRSSAWKIVVDVNTHDAVGNILAELGSDVIWANSYYSEETPDETIEADARAEGRIIFSHDRNFLKMIQQRRF